MQNQQPPGGLKGFFQRLRAYDSQLAERISMYARHHSLRFTGVVIGALLAVSGISYYLSGGNADRKEPVLKNPFYGAVPSRVSGIAFELSRMLERGPSYAHVKGRASLFDITEGSLISSIWSSREDTSTAVLDDTLNVVTNPQDTLRYHVRGNLQAISRFGEGKHDSLRLSLPFLIRKDELAALLLYGVLRDRDSVVNFPHHGFSLDGNFTAKEIDGKVSARPYPEEFTLKTSNVFSIPLSSGASSDSSVYQVNTDVSVSLR